MQQAQPKLLTRQVFSMLFLIALSSVLVTLGTLGALTKNIDELVASDTTERLSIVLTEWENSLALAVEDYAFWTRAYEILSNGETESINEDLGTGATESDLFDWLVILDASGKVMHSYNFLEITKFEEALGDAKSSRLLSLLSKHDPLEYHTVSGTLVFEKKLSLFSAARVTPDDMIDVEASSLPVLIGGISINAARLKKLEKSITAKKIETHFVPTSTEISLSFFSASDDTSYIHASPKTPGSEFRKNKGPLFLVFCALVLVISLWIALYFKELFGKLEKAIDLACTDQLTGLSSRYGLISFTRSEFFQSALKCGQVAIVNIDINEFKKLNDRHGHMAGDLALQMTAERLQQALGSGGFVARMGGDEFLCILVDQNPEKTAQKVVNEIRLRFREPFDLNTCTSTLELSIGIAVSEGDDNFVDLSKLADRAMYNSKPVSQASSILPSNGIVKTQAF